MDVYELILLSTLLACGNAISPAPVVEKDAEQNDYEPIGYAYDYAVRDDRTGDIKSHVESRDGDVVKGRYSLVEPDGSVRVVEYTADGKNGFNAVVKKQASKAHPPPAKPNVVSPAPTVVNVGHFSHGYAGQQYVYAPYPQLVL